MIILKILIITLASLILYILFSFIINFKDIKYVLKIKDVQIKNLPIKKYIKMDAYEFKDYCENKNKLLNKDEEGLVAINIDHLTRNFRLLYEGKRKVTFDNFFSDIFFIEISKRYFDIDSMTFNCALFYFDIDDSYNIVDLYNLYSKISKIFNKKGYYLLFITKNNRFYFESDDINPKSIRLSADKKLYLPYILIKLTQFFGYNYDIKRDKYYIIKYNTNEGEGGSGGPSTVITTYDIPQNNNNCENKIYLYHVLHSDKYYIYDGENLILYSDLLNEISNKVSNNKYTIVIDTVYTENEMFESIKSLQN